MFKKFPNADDYLTFTQLSNYLNITEEGWKLKKKFGGVPRSINLDGKEFYKWSDVIAWMQKKSCSQAINKRTRSILEDRNKNIIEAYKSYSSNKSLLSCAKFIAEQMNLNYHTVYNILYRERVNSRLNQAKHDSTANMSYRGIEKPIQSKKEELLEDQLTKIMTMELPKKTESKLFESIYNLIKLNYKSSKVL